MNTTQHIFATSKYVCNNNNNFVLEITWYFFLNHTILPVENRILLPVPVDFDIELQPSIEDVTTLRNAGEDLLSTCKSMADTTKVEGGLGVFGGVTTSGDGKPDTSGC